MAPFLFSPPQHRLGEASLPLDLPINTLLPDATGGDPSFSLSNFPLLLAHALLTQPECVSSILPAFGDLRAAASAAKTSRLPLFAGAVVSEARLVFGACFLLSQGSGRPSEHPSARTGAPLYSWLRALLADGTPLLGIGHGRSASCCMPSLPKSCPLIRGILTRSPPFHFPWTTLLGPRGPSLPGCPVYLPPRPPGWGPVGMGTGFPRRYG